MNDKESRIREQRTIEATKKGYMGVSGKFGTIVKYLGQPMEVHAEGGDVLRDTNYLPNWGEIEENNKHDALEMNLSPESYLAKIPTVNLPFWGIDYDLKGNPIELDEPSSPEWRKRDYDRTTVIPVNTGMYFYGLSSGINVEIRYDTEERKITVKFDGSLVYKEIGGELAAFVPGDWEEKVKILYERAKEREKKYIIGEKATRTLEVKKDKEGLLQNLKRLWGF